MSRFKQVFSSALCLLLLAQCGEEAKEEKPAEAIQPIAGVADEMAVERLRASPESVTYLGIDESVTGIGLDLGAKLDGRSPADDIQNRTRLKNQLAKLRILDRPNLNAEDRLNYDIAMAALQNAALNFNATTGAFSTYGYSVYPLNHMSGPQIDIPNLLQAQHPMTSLKNAEDYVSRLEAMAAVLKGAGELFERDAKVGHVLPGAPLKKLIDFLERFTAPEPADNDLYKTFTRKLGEIEGLDAEAVPALEAGALAAITDHIYPAYMALAGRLKPWLGKTHEKPGLWTQPGGAALYATRVRVMGDTDLGAEAIHQLGLGEVDRILAEMDAILISQGMADGTVGERVKKLGDDPQFIYPNTDAGRAELIAFLVTKLDQMKAKLPELFNTIPEAGVEVRRVPIFAEAAGSGAYYDGPSLDGSRPGIFWINLRDTKQWPSYSLPTLVYHEAVPGHHFEVALSMNATDRPLFRRIAFSSTYSEGWGLYAEKLAAEMGMYADDPFGDLGRLQAELFRAARLVVDTGLHYKKWSRMETINYLLETTGYPEASVISEVDRYSVWPGQAISYKMGMLKILELRARAQRTLGTAFHMGAFHDIILGEGPMPMSVIERRVDAWIKEASGG